MVKIFCEGCLLLPICVTKIDTNLMNSYYRTYFNEKYAAVLGLHEILTKCHKLKSILTKCFKKGTFPLYSNLFLSSFHSYNINKTKESDRVIEKLQVIFKLLNYENIKIESGL